MFDFRPVVLLGDTNGSRAAFLKHILETEFSAEVFIASNWDGLKVVVLTQLHDAPRRVRLILFTEDLPETQFVGSSKPLPQRLHVLGDMTEHTSVRLGCVGALTTHSFLGAEIDPIRIVIPNNADLALLESAIIVELMKALNRAPHKPEIELETKFGIPLEEDNDLSGLALQVQFLTEERTIDAGKRLLATIIRDMFCPDQAKVRPLSQGLSGATVFWISPIKCGNSLGDFALKVAPASELRKLRHEIEGHQLAGRTLLEAEWRRYFPRIVTPEIRRDHQDFIVSCGAWCAICYQLLGGDNVGRFMDLDTALLASGKQLKSVVVNTAWANKPLDKIPLDGLHLVAETLGKLWYRGRECSKRTVSKLWTHSEIDDIKRTEFPPYGFTGKEKKAILMFLQSDAQGLGPRILDDWASLKKRIRRVVLGTGLPEVTKLNGEIAILLSPCHGDLNTKNALLWLDHLDHPFLIDFPSFQTNGHALQDFARLEVEIKFAILDRHDIAGSARAWDYTDTQMEIWCTLDDHLIAPGHDVPPMIAWDPKTDCSTKSADRCLKLFRILRKHALQTQQYRLEEGGPSFYDEYLPPLLYHTLRAVRYDSLSIFKRILAVRSAGRIIDKLM